MSNVLAVLKDKSVEDAVQGSAGRNLRRNSLWVSWLLEVQNDQTIKQHCFFVDGWILENPVGGWLFRAHGK